MSTRRRVAPVPVVILAGGYGTRLAPYTSVLPKPLMPIGNRAILEILVDQLTACGFREITMCVGYLSHLIRAVFDQRLDEEAIISYLHETEPLGTAGPLRRVEGLDTTFLVMNGDVLTTLDFPAMVRSHRTMGSALTIATHTRTISSDYGILHLEGNQGETRRVVRYEEKPEIVSSVSMGVYLLEPRTLDYVPDGAYFDFPDLVNALLAAGEPVAAFPHDGLWLDIGRPEDHARAVQLWEAQPARRSRRKRVASAPAKRVRSVPAPTEV